MEPLWKALLVLQERVCHCQLNLGDDARFFKRKGVTFLVVDLLPVAADMMRLINKIIVRVPESVFGKKT